MKRGLRIPCAIAFTVVAGTAATAGVSSLAACGRGESPPDGPISDGFTPGDGDCALFCIPDDTDAGTCPSPAPCADDRGNCPPGCRPVG